MTEDQKELLKSARESIAAAKLLLKGGFPGFAASRAYYAMFYIAEAFLEGEGISFSRHSAVISAFGQHFANVGKVPSETHRFLIEAFDIRNSGDYGPTSAISSEVAKEQINRAEKFLELAEQKMGRLRGSE